MAKKSAIEKNKRRARSIKKDAAKRLKLKTILMNKETSIEERMVAQFKISEMSRNGSEVRYKNRCEITGRPRGFYRKFRMSRIALRELGSFGQIPGLVKSSW